MNKYMEKIIIAIDGPAGAGKSVTASLVADKLEYLYLDTGSMYRAAALLTVNYKTSTNDISALIKLVRKNKISFDDNGKRILINDLDVSEELSSIQIGKIAGELAMIPEFHDEMLKQQQLIGETGGIVAVGRDTTTAVFPNAQLKIFMTASLEERAKRRLNQIKNKGVLVSFEQIFNDLQSRDKTDFSRKHNPLRQAEDAILLDTTNMSISESVNWLIEHVNGILNSTNTSQRI